MIPLTRPLLDEDEARAVAEVLRSGMLVQAEQVARFERLVADRCGRRHGVAVASGTAALGLALRALDVKRDDDVLVPDLTWPSPAHAALELGARPVVVDVDAAEWNVRGPELAAARTAQTRAAIVVDQLGNPVRRDEIVAALGDVPVVEDAACALGSRFPEDPCGSMGAISCLSFHPRKVVTTGEGGMCLTDDDTLAARLRALRNHGQEAPGRFLEPSTNHRLSELAAAVGVVQMQRLDAMLERRAALAERYRTRLPELTFQQTPPGAVANHQTAGVLLPASATARERDAVIDRLREQGVQGGRLSYALHRLETLEIRLALGAGQTPSTSREIEERGLALPLYPSMTDAEQERVVDAVRDAVERRVRP